MNKEVHHKNKKNKILKRVKNGKIFISVLIITSLIALPVFAYDLDVSVDKEIEQKYDSGKLNKDMGIDGSSVNTKKSSKKAPKNTPVFDSSSPSISNNIPKSQKGNISNSGVKIPGGTKFVVKSSSAVSGSSGVNAMLSFTSVYGVYNNGVTIPAGTVFKGYVENAHQSQITGNGGLIEIKIVSMNYSGKTYNIDGKITKANSKKVFLNNIKGKRQYLSNVGKQLKKGVNIYNKVHSISSLIPNNPVNKFLSPVSAVIGAAGTVTNTVVSPVIAVFQKGQNISLPAGTVFEIKLTKDAYVN